MHYDYIRFPIIFHFWLYVLIFYSISVKLNACCLRHSKKVKLDHYEIARVEKMGTVVSTYFPDLIIYLCVIKLFGYMFEFIVMF